MSEQAITKAREMETMPKLDCLSLEEVHTIQKRFPDWSNDLLKLYIHELEKKHDKDMKSLLQLQTAVEKLEEKIKANKNSFGRTFFNKTVDDHANNIRHENQMCITFTLGGQGIFENFECGSSLSAALIKLSEKL